MKFVQFRLECHIIWKIDNAKAMRTVILSTLYEQHETNKCNKDVYIKAHNKYNPKHPTQTMVTKETKMLNIQINTWCRNKGEQWTHTDITKEKKI